MTESARQRLALGVFSPLRANGEGGLGGGGSRVGGGFNPQGVFERRFSCFFRFFSYVCSRHVFEWTFIDFGCHFGGVFG